MGSEFEDFWKNESKWLMEVAEETKVLLELADGMLTSVSIPGGYPAEFESALALINTVHRLNGLVLERLYQKQAPKPSPMAVG
jgi:hypothetical protein